MTKLKKKRVTIRQIIDAIRTNGYEQARGKLVRRSLYWNGKGPQPFEAACAMGQAAINLGVDAEELDERLFGIKIDYQTQTLREYIIEENDVMVLSCQEIANDLDILVEAKQLNPDKAFILPVREYIYKESLS